MSRKAKVKRNDSCPCGSGNKYKHCCKGRTGWNEIFRSGIDWIPFLSVRGRNIYFTNRISEALQLDDLGDTRTLKDYKAAFTTDAVRKIHEAIMEVWPPDTDINSLLENSRDDVSGLYIGR